MAFYSFTLTLKPGYTMKVEAINNAGWHTVFNLYNHDTDQNLQLSGNGRTEFTVDNPTKKDIFITLSPEHYNPQAQSTLASYCKIVSKDKFDCGEGHIELGWKDNPNDTNYLNSRAIVDIKK